MKQETTIGAAVQVLKSGGKITRARWLDKGTYLYMVKGLFDMAASAEEAGDMGTFLNIPSAPMLCSVFGIPPECFETMADTVTMLPVIRMHVSDRNVEFPYAFSHEDILAKDWRELENQS